MLYLTGLPGEPRTLAELVLLEKLDIHEPTLAAALTELATHKLCEKVHFSYDLNREEPYLLVLSRFAKDVPTEQMLEITKQALGMLTPVLAGKPQMRIINLDSNGDHLGWSEDLRQDLYIVEGDHKLVDTASVEYVDHFLLCSTFRRDFYDDEQDCQLSDLSTGLTTMQPGNMRRFAVLFEYDSVQDRLRYIDPNQESYDADGKWSRFQDDWIDYLPTVYQQKGATVQEFFLSFRPWPRPAGWD